MIKAIRRTLLDVTYPFNVWMGKVHAPYSHKKITGAHYYDLHPRLIPGMVFVTRTRGELTNVFIPGDWGHVAMYIGRNTVVEAIGKGVYATDLVSFMTSKDYIKVLTPEFATRKQMKAASVWWSCQIFSPYDYDFLGKNRAFYCAEGPYAAYNWVFEKNSPFKLKETLGVETITPQDYVDSKLWREVWHSANVNTDTLHFENSQETKNIALEIAAKELNYVPIGA